MDGTKCKRLDAVLESSVNQALKLYNPEREWQECNGSTLEGFLLGRFSLLKIIST